MSTQRTNSKLGNVMRVSSGNFLEMYDFMVYAYYASYIAHEIFPSSNAYASLMMTLGTFGAGYLMRPLGAVVLGAYVDRHGRRAGLILTLFLMAVGTLVIACTPAYRTIGIVAPIVVVIGRLLQGFSAGVGVGGASDISLGDGHARSSRILLRLAIGEPAGGCRFRGASRSRAQC